MGIPHLTTFLHPYAESTALDGEDAVVDGPALAYHVYYSCLSRRPTARNPFEAAPSYKEIGVAIIEWLDRLRMSGITIKRIYFDGFLPPSKLEVRSERLRKQTKRLTDYYHSNQIPLQASPIARVSESTFSIRPVRSTITLISPRPLLVPAVIDTLFSSTVYSPLVTVVPGEADVYCATYLCQHGGVVFTGDSDLLVHDLGPAGAVCFFPDLESTPESEPAFLSGHLYRPSTIIERLRIPRAHGLRALAFEIITDSQGSFRNLLKQAVNQNAIEADPSRYEAFCEEYTTHLFPLSLEKVHDPKEGTSFLDALQWLDPRVSEFVLQFPSLSTLAGQEIPNADSRHVFLPFLIDCPVRISAWEMSVSVRQLAYGLLNLIVPEDQRCFTMYEHRRQQKSSTGREWQLPLASEIPEACFALIAQFDQLSATVSGSSDLNFWTTFAVYHDVQYAFVNDKLSFANLATQQLLNTSVRGKTNKSMAFTWDMIHFFAQVEGSYYSFRILKQILGLLYCHSQKQHLPQPLFLLHDRLRNLPLLTVSHDYNSRMTVTQLEEIKELVKNVQDMLRIDDQTSPANSSTSSRKRRKKINTKKSTPTQMPNNLFDLLEVE